MTRVVRETLIEQSVQEFLRHALFTERLYPEAQIEMLDAFQQREFEGPVDKTYVTFGFNFDAGGKIMELGSNLREYEHQLELFVIAQDAKRGSNLAYAIRDALEGGGYVPLLDVTQDPAPLIDRLVIDPVRVEREIVVDPEPWQEFIWLVTVPVFDAHDPSADVVVGVTP